jgi:hypothetical protein
MKNDILIAVCKCGGCAISATMPDMGCRCKKYKTPDIFKTKENPK